MGYNRVYESKRSDIGRSREALWREIVNSEFGVMQGEMRHGDMEGRLCDFDNYDDLEHHIFHFCSEAMIAKKLLVHVEKYVDIPGIANPFDNRYTRPGHTH